MASSPYSAAALSDFTATATDLPVFQRDRHISYWLRCLRTPLPHQYTSNDSNRISLAFFTLAALDLLGVLHERTTDQERKEYADWIYSCQHPEGGFRACPAINFGDEAYPDCSGLDPASVPATFFALVSLALLRDDLSRVNGAKCLQWLNKMQRTDGSFGEMLGDQSSIEGGIDTRFGYCASGVRWILRTGTSLSRSTPDIDAAGLVQCINSFATYDGGVSQGPFNEGHAGLTYCAIAALSLLGRLPATDTRTKIRESIALREGSGKPQTPLVTGTTVRWLLSRLTTDIEEDESDDDDLGVAVSLDEHSSQSFEKLSSHPSHQRVVGSASDPIATTTPLLPPIDILSVHWVGCNGRSNKLADTCYVFWVLASLTILDSIHLTPSLLLRNYLLERTQHLVMGGFGKLPGALPDIYHAYLGLAALSLLTSAKTGLEDSSTHRLKAFDPVLCVSTDARSWIEGLSPRP